MGKVPERPPEYLEGAIEATKKGIDSFRLRDRPEERRSSVQEFGRAVEYLMRYALWQKRDEDYSRNCDNNCLRQMLKSRYAIDVPDRLLRRLRQARNVSEHEAGTIDSDGLVKLMRDVLPFLENFYEDTLGRDLEEMFPGHYLTALRREKPSAEEETELLMSDAWWYRSRDLESGVNMAQEALEIAIRRWGSAIGYDGRRMDIRDYVENWENYLDSIPPGVEPEGAYLLQFYPEYGNPRPIDSQLFRSYKTIAPADLADYLEYVQASINECLEEYVLAQTPQEWIWQEAIKNNQDDIIREVIPLSPSVGQMLTRTSGDIGWSIRGGALSIELFWERELFERESEWGREFNLMFATPGSPSPPDPDEAEEAEEADCPIPSIARVLDASEKKAIKSAIRRYVTDFPEQFPVEVSIPAKYQDILEE